MHLRAFLAIGTLVSFANLAQAAAPTELKIATWNLEWFMQPETMRALAPACTPADAPRGGARRSVPCDVANELARSREDIAALRRHAETLDADIVALLSVHLKSGCARDTLDSTRAGCAVLAHQIPILERWIDAQANG